MSMTPGTAILDPTGTAPPAPAPGSTIIEASHSGTARPPTIAYAVSWHDEPSIFLPEQLGDLETQLPAAIAQATAALSPSQPVEVIEALQALATRRGFDLPDGIAWTDEYEGVSSPAGTATTPVAEVAARYVRIVSSGSDAGGAVALSEAAILSSGAARCLGGHMPCRLPRLGGRGGEHVAGHHVYEDHLRESEEATD